MGSHDAAFARESTTVDLPAQPLSQGRLHECAKVVAGWAMPYCMMLFHMSTIERTPWFEVSDDEGRPLPERPYVPLATEMLLGLRIDETTIPKPSWLPTRAICTSAHKRLPDADVVGGRCCVSPRFEEVIERFDPGITSSFR